MTAGARMIEMVERFAASHGLEIGGAVADSPHIADRWQLLRDAGVHHPGDAFAAWIDITLVGGVVPPLLANSADVRTLLDALTRFHPLWGDETVVFASRPSGGATASLRGANGSAVDPDTLAAFLGVLSRMLRQLTHPPLDGVGVSADGRSLVFSAAQLDTPIFRADPVVSTALASYAESAVARHRSEGAGSMAAQVRRVLSAEPTGRTGLAFVARRLMCSTRTLQQRLLEEGTTFEAIVDDERRTTALSLLADAALSVTTVAGRCGYTSLGGFSRAMRRWTGMSPSGWRASR